MTTLEDRLAALERTNQDLTAEVERLKPKPPPQRRERSGRDFGQGDRTMAELATGRTGSMYDQPLVGSSTGGGVQFNTHRMIGDQRVYAPDGVPRDPATGEALQRLPGPGPHDGPRRTAMHEQAIRYGEAWMRQVTPDGK